MKKIAVVSLKTEHERRQHIDRLFKENELDFEYFDAIDKLRVADNLEKHGLTVNTEKMSTGEVACYLSHYCLWQQVVDCDLPYLMVFEDDIYFSKSAKTLLNGLDWLPSSFDVIKLETMYQRVMINKGISLPLGHRLSEMKSRHMGAAGYIISQDGAKKLISMTHKFGIDMPVDKVMFKKFIKKEKNEVYQLFPALCIQDKIYNETSLRFESKLEVKRAELKDMEIKPTGYQKVIRELTKVYKQLQLKSMFKSGGLFINGFKKQKIEYYE